MTGLVASVPSGTGSDLTPQAIEFVQKHRLLIGAHFHLDGRFVITERARLVAAQQHHVPEMLGDDRVSTRQLSRLEELALGAVESAQPFFATPRVEMGFGHFVIDPTQTIRDVSVLGRDLERTSDQLLRLAEVLSPFGP